MWCALDHAKQQSHEAFSGISIIGHRAGMRHHATTGAFLHSYLSMAFKMIHGKHRSAFAHPEPNHRSKLLYLEVAETKPEAGHEAVTAWTETLRKIRRALLAHVQNCTKTPVRQVTAVRPPVPARMLLRCRQSKHNVQAHRENTGMNFQAPGLVSQRKQRHPCSRGQASKSAGCATGRTAPCACTAKMLERCSQWSLCTRLVTVTANWTPAAP